MQVKRQRKPILNPNWCAFELLFQHLKHEALYKRKLLFLYFMKHIKQRGSFLVCDEVCNIYIYFLIINILGLFSKSNLQ
jgi:hypothetical protein